jgi:cephalosporin hydroxylase
MKQILKRLLRRTLRPADGVAPNMDGTEFETNNWILSDFVLHRLVPVVGIHPYPLNELMFMAGVICRFRPSHVFEWGTNIGSSARIFYETGRFFKIPLEIHSVDLPGDIAHVEHPGQSCGRLVKNKPGVFLHLGDGLETSLSICRRISGNKRALFFVDGDHSYDSVKRELEALLKNVADPVVLLHDTFYQSPSSGYNTGPHRAIHDVLQDPACVREFKTLATNTGLPGMTVIY